MLLQASSCQIEATPQEGDESSLLTTKEELMKRIDNPQVIDSIFNTVHQDSSKIKLVKKLSLHYLLKEKDSIKFRIFNKRMMELADDADRKKVKAEAYWDLAYFFSDYNVLDSAYVNYYLAYKSFLEEDEKYNAGRMLLNMAISQEKVKDYIGSETTTIQALSLIPSKGKRQIYRAFNNLAVVANGMEHYEQSLEYHSHALALARELETNYFIAQTLNNLGFVYQQNREYDKSILKLEEALNIPNISELDYKLYGTLLDNLSYSRFKTGDTIGYLAQSLKALSIRDSIGYESGVVTSKLHMGEYYSYVQDSGKALKYSREAYQSAQVINRTTQELQALQQLASLDEKNSTEYLNAHIRINDSLLKNERLIRNKFARIRFETDQYIQKTKMLNQQRIWIIISALIAIGILVLLYYYRSMRNLLLEKEQQDANQRIYDLLLQQQAKREEGRQEERMRISGDLHDGILGRLFGTRMNIGFLNRQDLTPYVEELQNIEKEIRNISHNLVNDINESSDSFNSLIFDLIEGKNELSNIQFAYHMDASIDFEELSNQKKIAIYRLLQESLQNAMKHSQAHRVNVKILKERKWLKLIVEDDGKGMEVKKNYKGIGLRSMKYRLDKINGSFHVTNSCQGIRLSFKIPL